LALAKELRRLAKQNLDHLEADVFKSKGLEPIKFIGTQKRSLWAADHIVPVVEGGGECGLENMRTLCIWCHQKVTAELKIRLGQKKI
jgi:5-methylcytosine-specific restriction endonuclease McrA